MRRGKAFDEEYSPWSHPAKECFALVNSDLDKELQMSQQLYANLFLKETESVGAKHSLNIAN